MDCKEIYIWKSFLGCFDIRISLCLAVVTCVYISVTLMELCPSISWIYRISTSASNKLVAKVCLNMWGVICKSISAREQYLFIILRTAWSDRGLPFWLAKKWLQLLISAWNSALYSSIIWETESLPIWIRRSLSPLPYMRMLPSCKVNVKPCASH